MRITAQEEYGLRCILAIARHQTNGLTAISEIAKAEGLSTQYVAKLLGRLHRAKLLLSVRGIHGGFRLTRAASAISAGEVLKALRGTRERRQKEKTLCETFIGNQHQCVHHSNCGIRPLWTIILDQINAVLNRLTLQDLLDEEAKAKAIIEEQFRSSAPYEPNQPTGNRLPAHVGGDIG